MCKCILVCRHSANSFVTKWTCECGAEYFTRNIYDFHTVGRAALTLRFDSGPAAFSEASRMAAEADGADGGRSRNWRDKIGTTEALICDQTANEQIRCNWSNRRQSFVFSENMTKNHLGGIFCVINKILDFGQKIFRVETYRGICKCRKKRNFYFGGGGGWTGAPHEVVEIKNHRKHHPYPYLVPVTFSPKKTSGPDLWPW